MNNLCTEKNILDLYKFCLMMRISKRESVNLNSVGAIVYVKLALYFLLATSSNADKMIRHVAP